ncbi:MAG: amidase [Gammaproteobacteria bacterium]
MISNLPYRGLVEIGKKIAEQKVSSVEVTETLLTRIDNLDPKLKSYVSVLNADAIKDARRADREIAKGKSRGPIHGVPVAVKDLCNMKGHVTTAGMPINGRNVSDHDATVVRNLRAAGAVILGKLHLTEGALAQHHPEITPPINPWAGNRWSGASSSGTGVSVAAGLAFGALGSDTGGSIRFPASCNGLVGLKPTYSRVSRYGVFALSETLDHIGPLTRSVEDAAAMLEAIAGRDANDPTSSSLDVPDYLATLNKGVRGLKIGIDRQTDLAGVDNEVKCSIERALRALKAAGAVVVSVKLPPMDAANAAWGPLCAVDAALAHTATFPSKKQRYGPPLAAFLELGNSTTGLEYGRAEMIRRELRGNMDELFQSIDLMIKPVFAKLNPTLKSYAAMCAKEGGLADLVRFTAPDDMTGAPTITLPAGLDKSGSPLSFQIVGRQFEEEMLFRAGRVWEKAAKWKALRPPLAP